MKKLILISILAYSLFGQTDPIRDFGGIPVILYEGPRSFTNTQTKYDIIEYISPDIFVEGNFTTDEFNEFTSGNYSFKVVPFNLWELGAGHEPNIERYAEGHYSLWETLDYKLYKPIARVIPDTNLVEVVSLNNESCIRTNPLLDPTNMVLINGPNYSQDGIYRFIYEDSDPTGLVEYIMTIRAAIQSNPLYRGELSDRDLFKLTIRYYLKDAGVFLEKEHIFSIDEFSSELTWEDLIYTYDYRYILELRDTYTFDDPRPTNNYKSGYYRADFVTFKITMLTNQYLLYLKNLIVHDNRGLSALNGSATATINNTLEEYGNNPSVVGWFGGDEPPTIDNYMPLNAVQSVVENYSAYNVGFFSAMTTGRTDYTSSADPQYKYSDLETYHHKVQPNYLRLTQYFYNYPSTDYSTNYDTVCNAYKKARDVDPEFGATVQAHEYISSPSLDLPPVALLKNQTNLALLFGAKEIGFYCLQSSNNTTGLIDANGNVIDGRLGALKDDIIPKLKGEYGQKLKTISSNHNLLGYSVSWSQNSDEIIFGEKLHSISFTHLGVEGSGILDVGFFEDEYDKKYYFMVLNRHYSTAGDYSIKLDSLNYKNWELTEYGTSTISSQIISDVNGSATFDTHFGQGEARLYSVQAPIELGGNLLANEYIGSQTVTTGDVTLSSGKTINVGNVEWIIDNSNIDVSNGSINVDYLAQIDLQNGGEFKFDTWTNSLFACAEDNHPKLIWGRHPNPIDEIYRYDIYKSGNGSNYSKIGETTGANDFEFVDYDEVLLNPQSGQGNTKYYKIKTMYIDEEAEFSNVVDVAVSMAIGKQQAENQIIVNNYFLEQNYPNPFNGITKITYGMKEPGKVSLIIYDVLGNIIKKLEDGFKESGIHTNTFGTNDASSGIYICKFQTNGFSKSIKLILLK